MIGPRSGLMCRKASAALRYFSGAMVLLAGIASAAALAGCAQSQSLAESAAATPAGALFCAVQAAGGGAVVVSLLDAEASALAPSASPVAVVATGLAKSRVDADCAAAGARVGGTGIAVSPPANPAAAPRLAVTPQ